MKSLALVAVLVAVGCSNQPAEQDAPPVTAPASAPIFGQIGFEGVVKADTISAVSDFSLGECVRAIAANDKTMMESLKKYKEIGRMPAGTRVKIIDAGNNGVKIRILAGGPVGATVWIPVESMR